MGHRLRLEDVRRARAVGDPDLPRLIEALAGQPDPVPDEPIRDDVPTFAKYLRETQSTTFRKLPKDEQHQRRVAMIAALEAENAEVPLTDRLRLHDVLLELWQDDAPAAREQLLDVLEVVPLVYGPWRTVKRIFKEAEERDDTEVLGLLAARFDVAHAGGPHRVSRPTLAYLVRRAWRYLRRLAVRLPACYADVAGDFLAWYPNETNWYRTWVFNHILYHETGEYGRQRFRFTKARSPQKHRAYGDLWRRTPRPLFSLLERAQSEDVRSYACDALKADFRSQLREVEPAWVARLVTVGSRTVDEFVVWILENVPRFEQAKFRELGLHEAVVKLFRSESRSARAYAVEYARTHARDLPLDLLIQLVDNWHDRVRKLALDLIGERDPRTEVGLDGWGRLLATENGGDLAKESLRKHFGASELTPEWFREQLLSTEKARSDFARDHLGNVHPTKSLGPGFFVDLVESVDMEDPWAGRATVAFAVRELARLDREALGPDTLGRLLVHPFARSWIVDWIGNGDVPASVFPIDLLKALAFHPDWDASERIREYLSTRWGRDLAFDEPTSQTVLGWLSDVRLFSPEDITFDWLMQLVQRSEPRYHDFAVELMIKVFLPADFAPRDEAAAEPMESTKGDDEAEINVDLGGQSFLFTGKLATMTRAEANGKVVAAGGSKGSSVNKKLDYLVIGDEGSPLYGEGRKGSKQVKAEQLIEDGAELRIISETAFLQMLAGEQREFSEDAVEAGCERLWEMLVSEGADDDPLRKFARKYLRRHHPDICLEETDRPVDPGAEIPDSFLTFDRVLPLFSDARKAVREFALEMAKWEFARWQPPIEGLVEMCEAPHAHVREFVAKALTADDAPEHRRYRVDPEVLTVDAVYSFCESRDPDTRSLGMHLVEKYPRLQQPEELFRLTESPDRRVRAFVIRTFWSLYRDRGITRDWKPEAPPATTVGKAARKKAAEREREIGDGPPARPEARPAADDDLRDLLRRVLFEIPPGRPEKHGVAKVSTTLRPLATRKAKRLLVETLRDAAEHDAELAAFVLPLLEEFMGSRGQSEFAACLVAVTRLRLAHPALASR